MYFCLLFIFVSSLSEIEKQLPIEYKNNWHFSFILMQMSPSRFFFFLLVAHYVLMCTLCLNAINLDLKKKNNNKIKIILLLHHTSRGGRDPTKCYRKECYHVMTSYLNRDKNARGTPPPRNLKGRNTFSLGVFQRSFFHLKITEYSEIWPNTKKIPNIWCMPSFNQN